jgi:peptidoglycan/LPS O-acetylase OafA/YrhL
MEERLHLKGLNGLRAIAAISVVLSHLRIALPEFPAISGAFDLASYGVTMFFTLSGFLITYLLFLEKKKKEISIKDFYIRRILRIWPLYFTYLAIAVMTIFIYSPGKLPGTLPFYLFFLANIPSIFNTHLPYLAQYWTLGVEEQFYLFWPWLMQKSGNLLKALVVFTACFLVLKLFFRFIYFKWDVILPLRILVVNRFECMSIGGIAAVLCLQKTPLFLNIVTNKFTQAICWLSLPLMALNLFHITPLLDNDLVALITVALIVNLSFNDRTLIDLENRFFDFLGKISYGIYIIHPLVIFYYASFLNLFKLASLLKMVLVYTGVLLLTIIFAFLSYELLEKRFLRLKDRFNTVKSSDSKYPD